MNLAPRSTQNGDRCHPKVIVCTVDLGQRTGRSSPGGAVRGVGIRRPTRIWRAYLIWSQEAVLVPSSASSIDCLCPFASFGSRIVQHPAPEFSHPVQENDTTFRAAALQARLPRIVQCPSRSLLLSVFCKLLIATEVIIRIMYKKQQRPILFLFFSQKGRPKAILSTPLFKSIIGLLKISLW